MPILWSYLTGQYLRVLCLCVVSFVAVLLTTRLEEIAHFVALGAQLGHIILFVSYQILYVLPIVMPIAALIAAIILMQRLSYSYELTAFRALGISLKTMLTPLLLTSIFLALANFYLVSELATHSHLTSRLLKQELKALNPLIFLNNARFLALKNIFVQTLGHAKVGESASDVVMVTQHSKNQRLNMLIAKELSTHAMGHPDRKLVGKQISLISNIPADKEDEFDHLVIENLERTTTPLQDFSLLLKKEEWRLNNDHLTLRLLLVRLAEVKETLNQALLIKPENVSPDAPSISTLQLRIRQIISEIFRRLSSALSVFTFTLMGTALGISISRTKTRRGMFLAIGLTAFYLVSFFMAKGITSSIAIIIVLYLLPHLVITTVSLFSLRRISRGVV